MLRQKTLLNKKQEMNLNEGIRYRKECYNNYLSKGDKDYEDTFFTFKRCTFER